MIKRILSEPLLHFLVVGAVFFAFHAGRSADQPATAERSRQRIEVNAATIGWLREGWTRQWGRSPTPDELRTLIEDHVREEVLYREALALGLDRDDTVIRRRLAQKMEFLSSDVVQAAPADEAALLAYFDANAARYARPPRLTFRHVYFSAERRPGRAREDARALLTELNGSEPPLDAAGDPFLHGPELADYSEQDIAAAFGPDFVEYIRALDVRAWRGPIPSAYGFHLVQVTKRGEPAAVRIEDVRDEVVRDLEDERRRTANRDMLKHLRARYDISIDRAALGAAGPEGARPSP
jgi:peptidyl-prolyl cis-trans isomerase C